MTNRKFGFLVPAAAIFALTFVALGTQPALAHSKTVGSLHIEHPWTRATPPGAKTAAIYFEVANKGPDPDRLIAVKGGFADKLALHTHTMDGGIARMRPVDGVDVPAGGTVALKPGGLHVMVFGLREAIGEMDRLPMTLVFEKAGPLEVEVVVEPLDKKAAVPHNHAGGGGSA